MARRKPVDECTKTWTEKKRANGMERAQMNANSLASYAWYNSKSAGSPSVNQISTVLCLQGDGLQMTERQPTQNS